MEPVCRKTFYARCTFALSNFVFVMGKAQINPARVQVKGRTEVFE